MTTARVVSLALTAAGGLSVAVAVALIAGIAWGLLVLGVLMAVAGLFLVDVA